MIEIIDGLLHIAFIIVITGVVLLVAHALFA